MNPLVLLSHILLLLLVTPAAVSSSRCDFPAIINLGDSNSDTGGISAVYVPAGWPNGMTFFGRPSGRFSDGRLMIDFAAESLGLPHLSAYMDSVGTNFSHGANFATAAAPIIPQNTTLFNGGRYSPFSLGVQVLQLSQFKSRSQVAYEKGGAFADLLPKKDYLWRALYMLDIGQNDLTAEYIVAGRSPEEFIPDAMDRFSAAVKSIYDEGGRSFWIHNTGPLGCYSYILVLGPFTAAQLDHIGCAIQYNELAQQFNRMLNETVVQMRKDLPLASITYVDVYSAKYSLFSHAKKFGFKKPVLAACCGYGGGEYNFNTNVRCGFPPLVNGTQVLQAKACKEPSKRISWDGIHYTEAANRLVFDLISSGAFSDPPVPLRMACRRQES